jgi:hypothetical protein
MSQYSDFFGVASSAGGGTVPINSRVEFYISDSTSGYSSPTGLYELSSEAFIEQGKTLPADVYGSTYPLATVTNGQMNGASTGPTIRSRTQGMAYHATRDQLMTAQALGTKNAYFLNVPGMSDTTVNFFNTPTTQPGVPQNILIHQNTRVGYNPTDDHTYITAQNTQNQGIWFDLNGTFSRQGYRFPAPAGVNMTGVAPNKMLTGPQLSFDGTYVHVRGGNTFSQYTLPTFSLDGTFTLSTPEPGTGLYTWTPLSLTKVGGPYSGGAGSSMAYDTTRSTYFGMGVYATAGSSWSVSSEAYLGNPYTPDQTQYPNLPGSKTFIRIG